MAARTGGWLAALSVMFFAGCTHSLEVKNLSAYRNFNAAPLDRPCVIGIVPSGGDMYSQMIVQRLASELGRYSAQVVMPYSPGARAVDVVARVNIQPDYLGSGWNFLINFPGFLVFAPAWNGYVYKVHYNVNVTLQRGDGKTPLESFQLPVRLDVRHANINRTWTEISWLEVGIIALVGGCIFVQYDESVTPLVTDKVQVPVADYIAQQIVSKVNAHADIGGAAAYAAVPPAAYAPAPTAPAQPGTGPRTFRTVHVLAVGVSRYEDRRIPPLPYATADAQAVYDYFRGPLSPARPENVHLLTEKPNEDGLKGDRNGILAAIRKYLIQKADRNSLVILYFSGHGDAGMGAGRDANVSYYLVPMDAMMDNLQDTAISIEEFQRRWDEINAGGKMLIADSCNSGGFVSVKGITVKGVDRLGGSGTVVFAASAPGQKALGAPDGKHSLFTRVLLDGLSGQADLPVGYGDGSLTINELRLWVQQNVPAAARKMGAEQTPQVNVPMDCAEVYLTK